MNEILSLQKQSIPVAAAGAMTVLAPAAAWGFLSLAACETGNEVYFSGGTADRTWHLKHLRAESSHLRIPFQPRVGEPKTSVAPFAHGLLVCVADERKPYGIVSLLREASQGPFQSDERIVLERSVETVAGWFALDEQLDSGRRSDEAQGSGGSPTVFIVDREMRVESAAQSPTEYDELQKAFLVPVGGFLAPPLARTVNALTASWGVKATDCPAAIAQPIPSLSVRVVPMLAGGHLRICVLVERIERFSLLKRAAERFSLSARELDVLELLLAGESTTSVATKLSIAEPTARDHIKRLLTKTGAKNRVEIASRFFGFRPRFDAGGNPRRTA